MGAAEAQRGPGLASAPGRAGVGKGRLPPGTQPFGGDGPQQGPGWPGAEVRAPTPFTALSRGAGKTRPRLTREAGDVSGLTVGAGEAASRRARPSAPTGPAAAASRSEGCTRADRPGRPPEGDNTRAPRKLRKRPRRAQGWGWGAPGVPDCPPPSPWRPLQRARTLGEAESPQSGQRPELPGEARTAWPAPARPPPPYPQPRPATGSFPGRDPGHRFLLVQRRPLALVAGQPGEDVAIIAWAGRR